MAGSACMILYTAWHIEQWHGVVRFAVQLKSPTSTRNNQELISGFTRPSPFTTQVSWRQQHLRTPWQCIQQFDVSSTPVSTCMHDGVLYYFMHWAITSEMTFVIILVEKTTVSWWALLIALVYQCADLLLLITTGPNSVAIYTLTTFLYNCDCIAYS